MDKLLLILLACMLMQASETLTGKVVKVQDGDTITILTKENEQIKIRLDGIDAPENGQDFSKKSKEYLSDLVAGKTVRIESKGKDRYKRTLGVVYVEGQNVNEAMIRAGLAWRYKHCKNAQYLELQQQAKAEKLHIWSVDNPVDPWQWRKDRKKKKQ